MWPRRRPIDLDAAAVVFEGLPVAARDGTPLSLSLRVRDTQGDEQGNDPRLSLTLSSGNTHSLSSFKASSSKAIAHSLGNGTALGSSLERSASDTRLMQATCPNFRTRDRLRNTRRRWNHLSPSAAFRTAPILSAAGDSLFGATPSCTDSVGFDAWNGAAERESEFPACSSSSQFCMAGSAADNGSAEAAAASAHRSLSNGSPQAKLGKSRQQQADSPESSEGAPILAPSCPLSHAPVTSAVQLRADADIQVRVLDNDAVAPMGAPFQSRAPGSEVASVVPTVPFLNQFNTVLSAVLAGCTPRGEHDDEEIHEQQRDQVEKQDCQRTQKESTELYSMVEELEDFIPQSGRAGETAAADAEMLDAVLAATVQADAAEDQVLEALIKGCATEENRQADAVADNILEAWLQGTAPKADKIQEHAQKAAARGATPREAFPRTSLSAGGGSSARTNSRGSGSQGGSSSHTCWDMAVDLLLALRETSDPVEELAGQSQRPAAGSEKSESSATDRSVASANVTADDAAVAGDDALSAADGHSTVFGNSLDSQILIEAVLGHSLRAGELELKALEQNAHEEDITTPAICTRLSVALEQAITSGSLVEALNEVQTRSLSASSPADTETTQAIPTREHTQLEQIAANGIWAAALENVLSSSSSPKESTQQDELAPAISTLLPDAEQLRQVLATAQKSGRLAAAFRALQTKEDSRYVTTANSADSSAVQSTLACTVTAKALTGVLLEEGMPEGATPRTSSDQVLNDSPACRLSEQQLGTEPSQEGSPQKGKVAEAESPERQLYQQELLRTSLVALTKGGDALTFSSLAFSQTGTIENFFGGRQCSELSEQSSIGQHLEEVPLDLKVHPSQEASLDLKVHPSKDQQEDVEASCARQESTNCSTEEGDITPGFPTRSPCSNEEAIDLLGQVLKKKDDEWQSTGDKQADAAAGGIEKQRASCETEEGDVTPGISDQSPSSNEEAMHLLGQVLQNEGSEWRSNGAPQDLKVPPSQNKQAEAGGADAGAGCTEQQSTNGSTEEGDVTPTVSDQSPRCDEEAVHLLGQVWQREGGEWQSTGGLQELKENPSEDEHDGPERSAANISIEEGDTTPDVTPQVTPSLSDRGSCGEGEARQLLGQVFQKDGGEWRSTGSLHGIGSFRGVSCSSPAACSSAGIQSVADVESEAAGDVGDSLLLDSLLDGAHKDAFNLRSQDKFESDMLAHLIMKNQACTHEGDNDAAVLKMALSGSAASSSAIGRPPKLPSSLPVAKARDAIGATQSTDVVSTSESWPRSESQQEAETLLEVPPEELCIETAEMHSEEPLPAVPPEELEAISNDVAKADGTPEIVKESPDLAEDAMSHDDAKVDESPEILEQLSKIAEDAISHDVAKADGTPAIVEQLPDLAEELAATAHHVSKVDETPDIVQQLPDLVEELAATSHDVTEGDRRPEIVEQVTDIAEDAISHDAAKADGTPEIVDQLPDLRAATSHDDSNPGVRPEIVEQLRVLPVDATPHDARKILQSPDVAEDAGSRDLAEADETPENGVQLPDLAEELAATSHDVVKADGTPDIVQQLSDLAEDAISHDFTAADGTREAVEQVPDLAEDAISHDDAKADGRSEIVKQSTDLPDELAATSQNGTSVGVRAENVEQLPDRAADAISHDDAKNVLEQLLDLAEDAILHDPAKADEAPQSGVLSPDPAEELDANVTPEPIKQAQPAPSDMRQVQPAFWADLYTSFPPREVDSVAPEAAPAPPTPAAEKEAGTQGDTLQQCKQKAQRLFEMARKSGTVKSALALALGQAQSACNEQVGTQDETVQQCKQRARGVFEMAHKSGTLKSALASVLAPEEQDAQPAAMVLGKAPEAEIDAAAMVLGKAPEAEIDAAENALNAQVKKTDGLPKRETKPAEGAPKDEIKATEEAVEEDTKAVEKALKKETELVEEVHKKEAKQADKALLEFENSSNILDTALDTAAPSSTLQIAQQSAEDEGRSKSPQVYGRPFGEFGKHFASHKRAEASPLRKGVRGAAIKTDLQANAIESEANGQKLETTGKLAKSWRSLLDSTGEASDRESMREDEGLPDVQTCSRAFWSKPHSGLMVQMPQKRTISDKVIALVEYRESISRRSQLRWIVRSWRSFANASAEAAEEAAIHSIRKSDEHHEHPSADAADGFDAAALEGRTLVVRKGSSSAVSRCSTAGASTLLDAASAPATQSAHDSEGNALRPWESVEDHKADCLLRYLDAVGNDGGTEAVERCLWADGSMVVPVVERTRAPLPQVKRETRRKEKAPRVRAVSPPAPPAWERPCAPQEVYRALPIERDCAARLFQPAPSARPLARPASLPALRAPASGTTASSSVRTTPDKNLRAVPQAPTDGRTSAQHPPLPSSPSSSIHAPLPPPLAALPTAAGRAAAVASAVRLPAMQAPAAPDPEADVKRAQAEGRFQSTPPTKGKSMRHAAGVYARSVDRAAAESAARRCFEVKSKSVPAIAVKHRGKPAPPPRMWRG